MRKAYQLYNVYTSSRRTADAAEPGLGKQPPAASVLKLNTGEAAVLLRLGARGGLCRGETLSVPRPQCRALVPGAVWG